MARGEPGFERLRRVFDTENGLIPTPVLVEFHLVMAGQANRTDPDALIVIDALLANGSQLENFDHAAAEAAVAANSRFGKGNGDGGPLNMLDLMVYGLARVHGLPILFKGKDFPKTDAVLHPSSLVG